MTSRREEKPKSVRRSGKWTVPLGPYHDGMSYRTFRRILGETNLERKCRWLLGAGTLVLMMTSFIVFARLTEGLANEQPLHTGRAVVGPAVARHHLPRNPDLAAGLDDLQR